MKTWKMHEAVKKAVRKGYRLAPHRVYADATPYTSNSSETASGNLLGALYVGRYGYEGIDDAVGVTAKLRYAFPLLETRGRNVPGLRGALRDSEVRIQGWEDMSVFQILVQATPSPKSPHPMIAVLEGAGL